jgi:hypothetical protein
MKAAIEQLSNDVTIVYSSLHFLETFPNEDPLRPEIVELLAAGNAALSEHLVALRKQVEKHRSQYRLTPFARVRTNYLRLPDNLFSLGKDTALVMPTRELVLFLLAELQTNIQNPENYTDCHTFDQGVLFRLRQLYQMTAPMRRLKRGA